MCRKSVRGMYPFEAVCISPALLDVVSSEDVSGDQAISAVQAAFEPVGLDGCLQQHAQVKLSIEALAEA